MKLAIVGSRTFDDCDKLEFILYEYFWDRRKSKFRFDGIIGGDASGADYLGIKFAEENRIGGRVFQADWNKYGKQAGFIRNQQIVDACNIVLAFWDGKSKGTKDTIDKARKAKKPTFIVYF